MWKLSNDEAATTTLIVIEPVALQGTERVLVVLEPPDSDIWFAARFRLKGRGDGTVQRGHGEMGR